jgi:hypothetical protein
MRNILSFCALAGIALLLTAGQSFGTPFGASITVWDKMGSNSSEDNEVEPNNSLAQKWDLEGFYLNGNALTMIGGFNFLTGASDGGNTFKSGDIFISTNPNDVQYGTSLSNPYHKNIFGYDYVLDMNYYAQTYQVYLINQNSIISDVYYQQNAGSNPYRYVSGGTAVGGVHSFQYITNPDLTGLGLQGLGGDNFHNSLTVDLSFLSENTSFFAHFTQECGNDTLAGMAGAATPEPATIVLVAGGLLVLFGYRRFKPHQTPKSTII